MRDVFITAVLILVSLPIIVPMVGSALRLPLWRGDEVDGRYR
jgi:hypothetical protein